MPRWVSMVEIVGVRARSVVLYNQGERASLPRADPNAALAPLARVVDQVSGQLQQVLAIALEHELRGNADLEADVLVGVDLLQCLDQLADRSGQAHALTRYAPTSQPRALELALDQARHRSDRASDRLRNAGLRLRFGLHPAHA